MIKRFLAYIAIIIGFLCFIIIGGRSMKYGNHSIGYNHSTEFYLYLLLFYLVSPVVGFLLIRWGIKVLNRSFKDRDRQNE